MLRRTFAAIALVLPLCAQDVVRLGDVPELARARSARQRPEQIEKLKPFLIELSLDYRLNHRVLDETIANAAALGDSIVPILLDNLAPSLTDSKGRYLAANSARVLAYLEPSSFIGTLIDLLHGSNKTGRGCAIYLLGCTGQLRAAVALAAELSNMTNDEVGRTLSALTTLESPAAATQAIALMNSADEPGTRRRVMTYLAATKAGAVRDQVLANLKIEEDDGSLESYITYFHATVKGDAEVTETLLPLLTGVRLRRSDYRRLVAALATIAPKGHKATVTALLAILDDGDTSSLGIATAVTLTALGDKKAQKILLDSLDKKINKRRRTSDGYAERADFHMAFERWKKAVSDYESAIKNSKVGSQRNLYHLLIARCEASRGQSAKMVRALKSSGVGIGTIMRTARDYPVFAAMLEKDALKKYLKTLQPK